MSIEKYSYLSKKIFNRNIRINRNVFLLIFLFAFFINMLSSVANNISKTQSKAEESSLTVSISDCIADDVYKYLNEFSFSDMYADNDNLIIRLNSTSDTYMLLSLLKQMNLTADYYNTDYQYNSQSARYLIKYLNGLRWLLFACICIALFVILYKKNITDEMKYILYRCIGYSWNNIIILLTTEILLITFASSVSGFLLSIPANILVNKALKNNLLFYEYYDSFTILLFESTLLIISGAVIVLTVRHLRKQSLSAFIERKM